MNGGGVESFQVGFLVLLFFVVAFASLAKRIRTPYPILLVIAGVLLSFFPGLPAFTLNPDVVFYVFLPPLIYAAAWNTSWREFSRNMTSILLLAIGLVMFTVVGVGAASRYLLAGFDWSSGIVLGAVVATTDAIAATSIASRMHVKRRIIDVIEGESLVNDATGLLALEFATAAVISGKPITLGAGALRLAYLSLAGVAAGLIVAVVVEWFERRIDDGPIEMAISVLVAYASYFAAEAVHASGILAVVATGLYLSRRSVHFFTPGVRIQAGAVWSAITFMLNALVFLLIGLQFRQVVAGISGYTLRTLFWSGAMLSLLVIVLRLIWVYPSAAVGHWMRKHLYGRRSERAPSLRETTAIGWAGMRGVIALAAALSLPAIPHRHLIVFMTFCVIVATLVVQGLTLPALIRLLHLEREEGIGAEERDARRMILDAALEAIEKLRDADTERFTEVYDDLAQHYETRRRALFGDDEQDEHGSIAAHADRYADVSRELLSLERAKAVSLREEGRIGDDVLRRLLRELDLSETRIHAHEPV